MACEAGFLSSRTLIIYSRESSSKNFSFVGFRISDLDWNQNWFHMSYKLSFSCCYRNKINNIAPNCHRMFLLTQRNSRMLKPLHCSIWVSVSREGQQERTLSRMQVISQQTGLHVRGGFWWLAHLCGSKRSALTSRLLHQTKNSQNQGQQLYRHHLKMEL